MLIRGYRNKTDRKYYVPAFVKPSFGYGFRIDLQVDTGASKTLLTANHIFNLARIIPNILPEGVNFQGIEGRYIKSYVLEMAILTLFTERGPCDWTMNISVSSVIDTSVPGLLGMDILYKFDIVLAGPSEVILRERTDIFK